MNASLFRTVCAGLAIAVGAATLVTSFAVPLPAMGLTNVLAVGMAALGIATLQK